jgi:hypothetical protein
MAAAAAMAAVALEAALAVAAVTAAAAAVVVLADTVVPLAGTATTAAFPATSQETVPRCRVAAWVLREAGTATPAASPATLPATAPPERSEVTHHTFRHNYLALESSLLPCLLCSHNLGARVFACGAVLGLVEACYAVGA